MTAPLTPNPLLSIALSAATAGLSVLPPRLDGSKAPLPCWHNEEGHETWKPAQLARADEAQIRRWYGTPRLTGIGLVTGAVSGNLELLEFDDRAAYLAYVQAAEAAGLGDLVARIERGYHEESPKPGVHWLYRCAEIAGNTKLASRPKVKGEGEGEEQVLIETRGEGGFVVIAPSNGKVHPTGGQYRLIAGGFDSIATITPEERRDLWALARSFDETAKPEPEPAPKPHAAPSGEGTRPGDDFNARADWRELLEAQGWTFVYRRGDCDYWRRPGKRQGVSACTGWGGKDFFYCFSTSTQFEPAKPYDKFGFHVLTVYAGDFRAAVKALAENGYGAREFGSRHKTADTQARPAQGEGAEAVDDAKLARHFQTDLGNSERLVARYGRELRYCFDFGKWLVWDGIRWAIDRNGAALDKAKETARAMLAEAATLGDKEDSRKLVAWSFRSQARDRMAAMLYLAQPDVSVRPEQLDTHPWLLNVLNGTLDLRTGTLRKPARADLLTKAAPVVYDPSARCEQWLSFLNRIFDGNVELIRYVQKAAGYSLTGLDTEECFFVQHGVGQNGKSTVVETLSALLGTDYAQQATPELLMQKKQERHPTELAVLRGARLVASVETGQGKRLNEALIKSMTGGDRIRANFMHQDTFEFRPEFKVWLSTNHKPVITGTDLGIWRRIRLIPFTVKIPDEERDGAFKARLREPAALSGILNWALEGVLLWQREVLKPPAAVAEATQAYREEMDVLAAWLADCCIIKKLAEASAADLYRSYVQWREQNGERPETQTSFGLRLTERGFERAKRRNGIFWLGIGLLAGEQCEQCEPISVIKDTNSGECFKNTENGFTPFTPFTPPADDGLSSHHQPVESTPADRNAPLPATATADAGELWAILKLYRGWETFSQLAKKLGWPQSRVIAAAQELQGFGRAEVKAGGWIRPAGEVTL